MAKSFPDSAFEPQPTFVLLPLVPLTNGSCRAASFEASFELSFQTERFSMWTVQQEELPHGSGSNTLIKFLVLSVKFHFQKLHKTIAGFFFLLWRIYNLEL